MRIIAILVLVFGVALAGGAIFFASQYFESIKASMARQEPSTVQILVAKHALQYGDTLVAEELQWVNWPKNAMPAGAFTSVEALFGEKGKLRRVVLRAIEPGEPILSAKISNFGESPRVAMNLADGMRAVSIRIDDVSGVSGFVAPGDHVDILLTRKTEAGPTSSVILQEITIIAVDQSANLERASPTLGRTVTVEVDTEQAQKLAVAQQVGKLSLTLRGFGEDTGGPMKPVTAADLSDLVAPDVVSGAKIRVRRGAGSISSVSIDGSIDTPTEPVDGQTGEQAPAN